MDGGAAAEQPLFRRLVPPRRDATADVVSGAEALLGTRSNASP